MGISVSRMLEGEFFKDYKVLAGRGGLNNQIQGFAMLDAPDGFLWTKGREFALSSGYVLQQNPGLFEEVVKTDNFKKIACFGIKVDRYLKTVPSYILKAFDELGIPLISIPSKDTWMDIINALNVMVMNRNIMQFNIREINPYNFSDQSYHAKKINKILGAVEYEMKFPAMIYDLSTENAYYSSPGFKEISAGLKTEDFWNPSLSFSKEILCDSLKMARYIVRGGRYEKPFSWITVPITVDGKIKAYFVVLEAVDSIDYFDQFALRTGFLLIQELYEQLLVARSIVDSDFEKFVKGILEGRLSKRDEITNEANEINIKVNNKYYVLVMEQSNENIILAGLYDVLKNSIRGEFFFNECRVTYVENNKCLFLIRMDENLSEKQNVDLIKEKCINLKKRLELKIREVRLAFGLSDNAEFVYGIGRNYRRAEQAIKVGRRLYPKDVIWTYSQMGAFSWLDIKDDEVDLMLKDLNLLPENEENRELVHTLKVYLECKMNFSLTAKKLFVHINTVRKRIEDITNLINLDLDDPMNRLKVEILLELFV
jgi:PucR family transcriptional regulator, purine catabolism regulatory protein